MNSTINLMHSPRFKLSKASSSTAIKFPSTFYVDRLLFFSLHARKLQPTYKVFSRTDPRIEDGEVVDTKSAHKLCSSHRKLGSQLSGIKSRLGRADRGGTAFASKSSPITLTRQERRLQSLLIWLGRNPGSHCDTYKRALESQRLCNPDENLWHTFFLTRLGINIRVMER